MDSLSAVVPWFGGAALAVATGVLGLSVVAKVADWRATTVSWPITGKGRTLAGPVVVTAVESALVVAAILPLPVRVRLAGLGVVFAAYAVAAMRLRGRECACFGSWFATRFSTTHALLCAAVAVACLGAAGIPAGADLAVGVASGAAALGVAAAGAVALWLRQTRRRARVSHIAKLPAPELVDHVVIFTTESCRFCAALQAQRDRYEAMAGCPLEFRLATEPADQQAAGYAYPAAVLYDASGTAVSAPAHGLGGIRDLLRHTAAGLPGAVKQPGPAA